MIFSDSSTYKKILWRASPPPHLILRASPPTLTMWPWTTPLGWGSWLKSSDSTGRVLGPWKNVQLSEPWNSRRNRVKSYLVTLPIFDCLDSLIGPSGLLLVVSHVLAVPVSVLWVRLEKKLLKLGCEKYFCKVTYQALVEMLFTLMLKVSWTLCRQIHDLPSSNTLLRGAPAILYIWPCNNISPFQDYLFSNSNPHLLNMNRGQ
jgi:hypothetical protein